MKILYVGYILFGDESATGNTLNNMFMHSGIEVMQCCIDYNLKRHNKKWQSVCVGKTISPFYYLMRVTYRVLLEKRSQYSSTVSNVISGHNKSVVVSFIQGIMDMTSKKISRKELKLIDDFSPDIIYTLAENISTLKMTQFFSDRYNAPIVFHIMDDIESKIYTESGCLSWFRKKYLYMLSSVYQKFKWHLAIGEKMANEFRNRHQCNFDFAMNSINETHNSDLPNNTPLKLLFSGGLHGGRNLSLLELALVINGTETLKEKIELHIYTSKNHILSNPELVSNCYVHEYVPAELMIENLSSADILLHVESFLKEEIEYFRYSMSTKLPEYLSVARPILCYGPMEINTVSFINDNNVGVVAEKKEELKVALESLLNESLRKKYAKTAVSVAEKCFLSKSVHERIKNVFYNSINDNK